MCMAVPGMEAHTVIPALEMWRQEFRSSSSTKPVWGPGYVRLCPQKTNKLTIKTPNWTSKMSLWVKVPLLLLSLANWVWPSGPTGRKEKINPYKLSLTCPLTMTYTCVQTQTHHTHIHITHHTHTHTSRITHTHHTHTQTYAHTHTLHIRSKSQLVMTWEGESAQKINNSGQNCGTCL